jgi:hypothetical protein
MRDARNYAPAATIAASVNVKLSLLAALLAVAPLAVAEELDELMEVEKKLAMSRFEIPPCADAGMRADFEKAATQSAAKMDVKPFTVAYVEGDTPVPNAPLQFQHFDLGGEGAFSDVQWLLHRIAFLRELRMIDFESLHVQPRTGGNVAFDARVRIACWVDVPGTSHSVHERIAELRAQLAAVTATGEAMRPLRLTDGLALLSQAWAERPLLLSEVRYAPPALTLRGSVLGSAAREGLKPALQAAGFEPVQLDVAPSGDCRTFTAVVNVKGIAGEPKLEPRDIFDDAAAPLCAPPPATPAKTIRVRGNGTLTVHTHDLDLTSALYILNGLDTSHGYVVGPGVSGRVRLDLENATIGDTLAALRNAGFAISDGPLHLVCATTCGTPAAAGKESDPVTITVTNAQVRDILRTFEEAVPGTELYAAPATAGTVSLYVVDEPWQRILASVAAVLKTKVSLTAEKGLVRVAGLRAEPYRRSLIDPDPAHLAVADVRLAATTATTAYAEMLGAPGRVIALDTGTKLLDGEVTAVDAQKVTIKTADGRTVTVSMR